MPLPSQNIAGIRLTDQEEEFVRQVTARGRKPDDAARAAGYEDYAPDVARNLLRRPAIGAAIRLEITRLLTVEALPLAYGVLTSLARDESVPPAVRRACARDLIDRAGVVPPKAGDAGGPAEKPLSEMSSEELRALVDKLESELGARATDVSAPSLPAPSPKSLSWDD